jgi:hypothetical protein
MMSQDKNPQPVATASKRRLKYGMNVAVAVLVAVAVVVVVNALAFKFFLFKDLTALGQYSLSKQTRQVLASLKDDYTIATLMTAPDPGRDPMRAAAIQQTTDLVDVYARHSSRITAQHFMVGRDAAKIERFFANLVSRYDDQLTPTRQAIDKSRAALGNLHEEVGRQIEMLKAILAQESFTDPRLREFTTLVLQMLARFDQRYKPIADSIDELLLSGMPDYTAVRDMLQARLREMKDKVYAEATAQFEGAARSERVPPQVREMMLQTNQLFARAVEAIEDGLRDIDEVVPVEEYDALRNRLADSGGDELVVVIGPRRVQVVSLSEMSPDLSRMVSRESPELRFVGEERLTGSLISMSLEQPPLVVFVSAGPPAIGPQGMFEHVARRLRSVNFDVQMWNPAGQMASFGQMVPPGPPPMPAPGQKAVWIVCPFPPDNPMNPMAGAAKTDVASLVSEQIDQGHNVMFMLSVNPGARFGAGDPVAELLGPWGITPRLDQVVWREVVRPDRQTQSVTQFIVDSWPEGMAITDALQGMTGIFVFGSPLVLGSGDLPDVTRYPLVRLEGPRIWAEDQLNEGSRPQFKPATAAESFLIGVAAQSQNKRIVAIADPGWAADQMTTYSRAGQPGEDFVTLFGAAFPANAELFVNSVYWLAGLEELIAASPRSQDIRRIEPMSPATHTTLRWVLLAGVPAVAFAAGVGMWLVRRRS